MSPRKIFFVIVARTLFPFNTSRDHTFCVHIQFIFMLNWLFQVQAYIMSHLRNEMPSMFGKESKKKELIQNLGTIFGDLQRQHQVSSGDFPNLERMQVRKNMSHLLLLLSSRRLLMYYVSIV